MSKQRTLEQERANAAWDRVSAAKRQSYAKKYGQLAKGAAAEIQVNGLGQVVSFWRAKHEVEHRALYTDVSNWLRRKVTGHDDVMAWIVDEQTTSNQYRRATAEAIAFLTWLKRFAEAELGGS